MNVPRDVNAQHLGAAPCDGVGSEVSGSLTRGECSPGADGAVGGSGSTAYNTFFSAPLEGYPACQPLVSGDASDCVMGVNPYLHQASPNLFGLHNPVHAGTAQAGVPCVFPVAAVHAMSTQAA